MTVPRDEHGMLDLGKVSLNQFTAHYRDGFSFTVQKNRDELSPGKVSFAPICCERIIPAPPTAWQRINREEDPF